MSTVPSFVVPPLSAEAFPSRAAGSRPGLRANSAGQLSSWKRSLLALALFPGVRLGLRDPGRRKHDIVPNPPMPDFFDLDAERDDPKVFFASEP